MFELSPRGVAVGTFAVLAVLGCGPEPSSESPTPAFRLPTDIFEVGSGAPRKDLWGEHQDRLFVNAHRFVGETKLVIDPRSVPIELEFIPLALGESQCTVEMVLDGAFHWTGVAHPSRQGVGRGPERFERLSNWRATIVVAPASRGTELLWRAVDCDGPVLLAMPRVRSTPAASAPDVLLTCSDTHRRDHALGELGRTLMPNLTALGERGIVFDGAFSNATWTLPALASVLTGRFPRDHGTGRVVEYSASEEDGDRRAAAGDEFVTGWAEERFLMTAHRPDSGSLARDLQQAGYVTMLVTASPFYRVSGLAADGWDVVYDVGVAPAEVVNRAVVQVSRLGDLRDPELMLVHWMDVHHYADSWRPVENSSESPDEKAAALAQLESYRARVEATDRALGEIVRWWDRRHGSESLVAFYSDHGELLPGLGDPGAGHGQSLRDELLRIPLVVRPPGPRREGSTVSENVSLRDLRWMVRRWVGLDEDGAEDRPDGFGSAPVIFSDFQLYGDEQSSVRSGDDELEIDLSTGDRRLLRDDRPVDDPVLARALYEHYREYVARTPAAESPTVEGAEAVEALEAVGYVN